MAIASSTNPIQRLSPRAQRINELLTTGVAHHQNGRLAEADLLYKKVRKTEPNNVVAIMLSGVLTFQLGQFELSLNLLSRAISLKPDYAMALYNRGNVLTEIKRFDEAMADYDKAISLNPDYAEALYNRGNVFKEIKRFDEAMADYDKAISLKPDYAEAHWNKSLQLLLRGEFASGWELYEWRWKRTQLSSPIREFEQPLWLGKEDLHGKTILLHWEQGLGDTIQFSRYVQEVANLGCKTILEVQKHLFELMKGIEGVDELIPNGADLPPFDFYCPLMSLPLALGTTLETIPSPISYIKSTDDKLAKWSDRLRPKSKPRVGIVWSGSSVHKNDHNRSIALEQILGAVPEGYHLVSLQKEVRENDLDVLEQSKQIQHFGAELDDFTDTAALCELMDVIVSVDTSVAHLAGAMGKPVNLLLPYDPDFRWLLNRGDSPWYPSITLFRQGPERLWEPVLMEINASLQNYV